MNMTAHISKRLEAAKATRDAALNGAEPNPTTTEDHESNAALYSQWSDACNDVAHYEELLLIADEDESEQTYVDYTGVNTGCNIDQFDDIP